MPCKSVALLSACLLALVSLLACQEAVVLREADRTFCRSNADCPSGDTCHLDSGLCVANGTDGDHETETDLTDLSEGEILEADKTEIPDLDPELDAEATEPTPDGDEIELPEAGTDGDPESEEVSLTDGDESNPCAVVRCTPRRHCVETSGQCDYDSDHCHLTGCGAGAKCDEDKGICQPDTSSCLAKPCETPYTCNKTTGKCDVDGGLYPNSCAACTQTKGCENGRCMTSADTLETYCAPPCIKAVCPSGTTCNDEGFCEQIDSNCGQPHGTGGACTTDANCGPGAFCITQGSPDFTRTWPRGYCTKNCTKSEDCGGGFGSTCLQVAIANGVVKNLCLTTCNPLFSDCREGYTCSRTNNPMVYTCLPNTAR